MTDGSMSAVEKNRARAASWQKANPEKRKLIRDKWIANNLEKMRAIRAAWKDANKDRVRAYEAERMRKNPEKRAAQEATRRARKAMSGGRFTAEQIRVLEGLQKGCCAICRDNMRGVFNRDHIMPIALGGSSDISNIQLLCPKCNSSKGAKDPIEHAQRIGRLL